MSDGDRLEVEVSAKKDLRQEWLAAVGRVKEREQEKAAKERERLRRVWAKVGLTLEEAEEMAQELARKFQGGGE